MSGFIDEMRNIDLGERIGALDREQIIGREACERLARLERRKRAFEPAQIEPRLRHSVVVAAGGRNGQALAA